MLLNSLGKQSRGCDKLESAPLKSGCFVIITIIKKMFQILIFALLAGHSMADDFVYTWGTDFLNAGEVTGPVMLTNCIVPPKVSNDTTGNPVGELQNVRTLHLSESALNSPYITSISHSSDDAIQDRFRLPLPTYQSH